MTRGSRWRSKLTELTSMLVLGAGLLLLFEPSLAPIDFWVVWIVGFVIVVPMVELLLDVEDDDTEDEPARSSEPADRAERSIPDDTDADTRDAIETLRERYARGDLTDEQFERKLDRLLQTDTPENAAEWRDRATGATSDGATSDGTPGSTTDAATDTTTDTATDVASDQETDSETDGERRAESERD